MIRLELQGVPPTTNHAYENVAKRRLPNGHIIGGGRRLTDEGRAYLLETKTELARRYRQELQFFRPNAPYLVFVRLYFSALENAGFFKKKKTTQARHKKLDLTNRIKLLEDALKDVGGVDDSQNFKVFLEKLQGERERTIIWIWDLEEEATPFDDILMQLQ